MATTATPPTKPAKAPPVGAARPIRKRLPNGPPILRFYRSAVGKKWVMAVTGVILMGFIVAHLIGNLKFYLSKEEINLYGEALRDMPGHLLPRTFLLWTIRSVLIVAFVLHLHSAYGLTVINKKARPQGYQSKRDYVAAELRVAHDALDRHHRPALPRLPPHGPHVGQRRTRSSCGAIRTTISSTACNDRSSRSPTESRTSRSASTCTTAPGRCSRAWASTIRASTSCDEHSRPRFAALIVVGNLSFPILVQAKVMKLKCPHTEPTTQPCKAA